jgi:hypothetical protein
MKHLDARHHSAVVAAVIFQLVNPPMQITPDRNRRATL